MAKGEEEGTDFLYDLGTVRNAPPTQSVGRISF
jgi:hypothetical protein